MSKTKSKPTKEFYISIDMESDGPCPGVNSMLQFGAVFYNPEGNVLLEQCFNILELDGAVQDPETMKWWAEQEERFPGIWDRLMENRVTPKLAMERFTSAVELISQETDSFPVVVAYPAGFDFTFLYWYLNKFVGKSCVGFSALDMKTLAMALINRSYHDSAKRRFPKEWSNPELKHTHNALDDARGQGYMFFRMMDALKALWSTQPQLVETT